MTGLAIGIDVGGTKTHIRAEENGVIRSERVISSRNWRTGDWDADSRQLPDLIAGVTGGSAPAAALVIGAHGCDSHEECQALQSLLAPLFRCPVIIRNDAELLPAATGRNPAIGLICGTGSVAVTRNPGGPLMVAGGWGWILGDEGSAAALVREAARRIAHSLSATGSSEALLTQVLTEGLGAPVPRFGQALSRLGSADKVGELAPIIFAAAENGSHAALSVIREGAAGLAGLTCWLKNRGAEADHVVCGGGVFVAQPGFYEMFREELKRHPDGTLSSELFSDHPVAGACRLAGELAMAAQRGSRFQTM